MEELFKMLQAACCSSSNMSMERAEGMSTMPQAQGYHNELPDAALPTNVPGMPHDRKPSEDPAKTVTSTPEAPAPTQAACTSSTAEPDAEAAALPDVGVEDDAPEEQAEMEFETQDMPTQDVDSNGLSAEQQKQAKSVIKDFVKEMVRGRKMSVISKAGAIRACTVFLGRKLDTFKIQAGSNIRKIPLTDISDLHVGQDGPSIDTPLDDLCCTMALAAGECLTFRFPDITARDTFAMCMLMFVNGARGS